MLTTVNRPKSCVVPLVASAPIFRLNMPNTSTEFYRPSIPFEQGDHNKYTLNRSTTPAATDPRRLEGRTNIGHLKPSPFDVSVGADTAALRSTSPSSGFNNSNDDNQKHNFKIANNNTVNNNNNYAAEHTPNQSYVDDLHNYSKPRFCANWATDVGGLIGDESEEESDDMDAKLENAEECDETPIEVRLDDSGIQMMEEEHKLTPDHHARRPMNAFLIFCKRHRSIVREKYPNLENRAITKILGDWWANMDVNEKACFTDLAKEYKDAFFNANPTFKWYKLPAPPLRTLNTRPGNPDRTSYLDYMTFASSLSQHSVKGNQRTAGGIRNFKLADEAEMGGLNSLISSHSLGGGHKKTQCVPYSEPASAHDYDDMEVDVNDLKQKNTDSVRSVASKPPRKSTNRTEPFCQHLLTKNNSKHKHLPRTTNGERHSSSATIVTSTHIDFERFVQANWSVPIEDTSFPLLNHVDGPTDSNKSARACKGKRYLEFINTVKVNSVTKKPTKPQSTPSTPQQNTKPACYRSTSSSDPKASTSNACKAIVSSPATSSPKTDDAKIFDSIDFDLDGKINALTALNLDQYLLRKRDTKKKRKITGKRGLTSKGPQTVHEAKELLKRAVGSQKRKARKESITRRDVPVSPVSDLRIQMPAQETMLQPIVHRGISPEIASSDLFILAEVAAAVTN